MFFMAERWTREIKRVKTFGNWMQYEVARSVCVVCAKNRSWDSVYKCYNIDVKCESHM